MDWWLDGLTQYRANELSGKKDKYLDTDNKLMLDSVKRRLASEALYYKVSRSQVYDKPS